MKKVYIAGQYGRRRGLSEEECEANVYKAIEVARKLIKQGWCPFIPHLYHFCSKGWHLSPDEDVWFSLCKEWIGDCEAIFMMKGWAQYDGGAVWEYKIAKELKKEILFEV